MRTVIILVGLVILVLVAAAPAAAQTKYDGNGHYYDTVSGSYSWGAARSDARRRTYDGMRGHLVTITSSGENSFIKDTLLSGSGSWWTGGFQEPGTSEPSGDWEWVTGETWSYTNWASGEPNDSGGEDAMEFIAGSGRWNDNRDYAGRSYIVEYERTVWVAIEDGAAGTNSADVTLHLSWDSDENPTEVRMRNVSGGVSGAWSAWTTAAATKSWTLDSGEGRKTVDVEFRGTDGVVLRASDDIWIDTVAPTGSIVCEGGADWTNRTAVSVSCSYSDNASGVAEMRFRDAGGAWGAWTDAAATGVWTVPVGEGTKTIEAQFRDGAGNGSDVSSDSIDLDTTAPALAVSFPGGNEFTGSRGLEVRVDASDSGSGVQRRTGRARGPRSRGRSSSRPRPARFSRRSSRARA